MSGTNAHAIVEAYDGSGRIATGRNRPLHLLVLSAKTEMALRQRVADLVVFLANCGDDAESLTALGQVLSCGRTHFDHRCALVAATSNREAAFNMGVRRTAK